jgi:hypothetical protein
MQSRTRLLSTDRTALVSQASSTLTIFPYYFYDNVGNHACAVNYES